MVLHCCLPELDLWCSIAAFPSQNSGVALLPSRAGFLVLHCCLPEPEFWWILNVLPSGWKQVWAASSSLKSLIACFDIRLKAFVGGVGSITQSCFPALTNEKGTSRSLLSLTWLHWPSCNWMIMHRKFMWGGQPEGSTFFHTPCLLTVSNVLFR